MKRQTVQCGTFSALLCDTFYIGVQCFVVQSAMMCLWKEYAEITCRMVSVLYIVTLQKLAFVVVCITYSNVVFMEGTHRRCSVALSVLYFVTVYIFVVRVKCVTVNKFVFMERRESQCIVHIYNAVLCEECILCFCFKCVNVTMLC